MEGIMKPKTKNQFITLTALLTALAIVIPMIMPVKIIIPPASYTLASHVPIFLAMFISLLSDILRVHDSAYCPSDRGNLPVQYNPVRLYSVYRKLKAVQMLYWIR